MNYFKEYADGAKKYLKPKRKISVVVDASNGYAGNMMKEVFKGNNLVKAFFINSDPDGDFPGHGPNPLAEGAMDDLRNAVIKNKADLGLIFDGDADRVMFVDDKGDNIDPDTITGLCLRTLKPKKAVIDIRVGWEVRKKAAKESGTKLIRAKVGNYFIKKAMIENDADFGAERASHYYLKKNGAYIDVAPEISCMIITAASKMKGRLSDLSASGNYFRLGERNFSVKSKEDSLNKIEKHYSRIGKISKKDGISFESKEYWINVRPSANEDLLRVNIEATASGILKRETEVVESLIHG